MKIEIKNILRQWLFKSPKKCLKMKLVSTLFETKVIIATKIRREKNENFVDFLFYSISGWLIIKCKWQILAKEKGSKE